MILKKYALIKLIFFSLLLFGCSRQDIPPKPASTNNSDPLLSAPNLDTNYVKIVESSKDFVEAVLNSNINLDTLAVLLHNEDYAEIYSQINMSTQTALDLRNNIYDGATAYLQQHNLNDSSETYCPNCDDSTTIATSILFLKHFKDHPNDLDLFYDDLLGVPNGGPSGCNMGLYMACTAGCAVTFGPTVLLGAMCVYGCFCSFCWGPRVDTLCNVGSGGNGGSGS